MLRGIDYGGRYTRPLVDTFYSADGLPPNSRRLPPGFLRYISPPLDTLSHYFYVIFRSSLAIPGPSSGSTQTI